MRTQYGCAVNFWLSGKQLPLLVTTDGWLQRVLESQELKFLQSRCISNTLFLTQPRNASLSDPGDISQTKTAPALLAAPIDHDEGPSYGNTVM